MGLSFTVLGCSGSYPGRGQACSGYLVQGGGVNLIIDLGPGSLANLQNHIDIGAIDAVILTHRHPDHWTDLAGLRVLPLISESLRAWIGGYRLHTLHRELFERELHIMARTAGARRRKPSRVIPCAHGMTRTLRPALFGLTRDEALTDPGSALSLHFLYTEPSFRFTSSQQELLTLALLGQADTEAAITLDISLSTVKKHWQAVFERVARVRPDWLQHESVVSGDGKRGAEKRRHLLNYLRQHLEELRPLA